MTLTEQLYEGTLPTGWYYFNNGVETYIVLYSNANTKDRKLQEPEGLIVLCEVPTYEEYEQMDNWNNFTADYHALLEAKEIANAGILELKNENAKLKYDIEQYHSQYKSLLKQNEKLLENTQSLAKLVLKLSPERKEWLEKHYGEYL
jgi:hypothetical protein